MKRFKLVLFCQGLYYFITGAWPIFHIESFMAVTGPKTDIWLVKTVGLLIVSLSLGFLVSYYLRKSTDELWISGISSALFLAFIDSYYSLNGTISIVYLADALIQIILILLWVSQLIKKAKTN
jgi:hypothetical protein